ncbi:hypothetical protein [Streptomyces rubiginosohelvolus]|uniref:hypothetical protein n=1 Tax=Streptomyces rubiginosohelvolus TaxID=67362 RepID=UPI0036740C95
MTPASRIDVGDRVTCYSEGDNVGTVVTVRRAPWAFFGRVCWVDWGRNAAPVPHAYGLKLVQIPAHMPLLPTGLNLSE